MTIHPKLNSKKILLASGSPRRKDLLAGIDLDFEIVKQDVDETWPQELSSGDIAEYLAKKKNAAYNNLKENEIIITADTIVWHNNKILNKPIDSADASRMLHTLSDGDHQVYTGVCIRTLEKTISFQDETRVTMKKFSDEEIAYYVKNYSPMDKAGSYGAQDWLGFIGIEKIEGCYYNVMGLPVRRLYAELLKICD